MTIIRGSNAGCACRLVLFGAEDRLIPKDAIRFHDHDAPGLQLEFVPGGAHFLVDDQPRRWLVAWQPVGHRVAAFLGASRQGRGSHTAGAARAIVQPPYCSWD
jgi:hypothetical protein